MGRRFGAQAGVPRRSPRRAARPTSRERVVWVSALVCCHRRGDRARDALSPPRARHRRAPDRGLRSSPPQNVTFDTATGASIPAVSPDGHRLAFVADGQEPVCCGSARSMLSTPNRCPARKTRRSPSGRPTAAPSGSRPPGKLKKIDVSGGPPLTLCDGAFAVPGTWNRDEVILFTPAINAPLSRVSAASGTPSPVTALDTKAGERVHFDPFFLPDGRHFLYAAASVLSVSVFVGSLDSGDRKLLLTSSGNVQYDARLPHLLAGCHVDGSSVRYVDAVPER